MSDHNGAIRVLHVDDKPEFLETAVTFVERQNDRFDIEIATSPSEGLDLLDSRLFDCIVSDYEMPTQNGLEFLQDVREQYPDLPFILYTGKGSEAVASDAISAGVTDYLQKEDGTSQYTVLANRIRNAVDNYHAQTELADREKRLSLFFEQSPLGVVEWDERFDLVRMNDAATDILGYTQDDLVGHSWKKIVPESDQDGVDDVVSAILENSGGYRSRNKNIRKNGDKIVCEWHNRVVTDEDGEVVAVFSQFQDITERREQQQKLERTRRRLELALETTDTGVYEWNMQTDEVIWSDSLERVMGFDPGDFEGTFEAFTDRVHPDDLAHVQEEIEQAVETDSTYRIEFRMQHADGSYRWVAVRGDIRRDEDGDRMVGVHHDITQQKDQETTLDRQRSVLKAQQEAIIDGLVVVDENGDIVSYNDQFLELWGMPEELVEQGNREAALDWAMDELAAPEEFRKRVDYLHENPEETARDEITLTDGRVLDRHTTPVIGEDGTHYGRLWAFRDITQQKQREEKLERARDIFSEAESLGKLGVWEFTASGEISWSDGTRRIHEVDEAFEPTVEAGIEFYHPDDRDMLEQAVENALETGEPYEVVARLSTANDNERWVRTQGKRLDDGETIRGYIQDITERKEYEQELEQQNERLEEFTSVVSHDLRNPLSVASGYVELAQNDCDSEHLEAVEQAHTRMDTLIDDLLTLARDGEQVGEIERVGLAPLVESCWQNVDTPEAAIRIAVEGTVQAYRSRLQQLVENLLQNAVTHGGEDVTVTVGQLADGFYIEDNGSGIPEADQDAVFAAGYSTSENGTGFGLQIVKEIVEAHDWEIRVTNGTNGGARFEITSVEVTPQ